MNVVETSLPGVLIIDPEVFRDKRGFFLESFHKQRYAEVGVPGVDQEFVQDNHSQSNKKVLRGLHFQIKNPQGKLVSVSKGKVFDVVADVAPDSPNYRKWVGVELNEDNHRQLWIPPSYAHGFCVLSDVADFHYKCTALYHSQYENGIRWDDPEIGIEWPISHPILSNKDASLPLLSQILSSELP